MTSLDDLRATLDHHSTDLADRPGVGAAARSAAVRDRVQVVRRRRRAVAAGGAATLLAAVAGVVLLPDGGQQAAPEPAATVVGVTPPEQLSALGFGYDLSDGIEGSGRKVQVDLDASDEPRLVSWATSGIDDRVTLTSSVGAMPLRYDVADFGTYTYVAAGEAPRVTVVAESGRPGLAVYTLGDERPAGFTKDGITFREQIADGRLAGAAVGDPGQAELDVVSTFDDPGALFFAGCTGGGRNATVTLVGDPDGDRELGGCSDEGTLPIDPGGIGGTGFKVDQESIDFTVRVTDGPDGPLVDDPDLRVWFGIYSTPDPFASGADLPATLEEAGHTWRRADALTADGRAELADGLDTTVPDDGGPVLVVVFSRVTGATVRVTFDSDQEASTTLLSELSGTSRIVNAGDAVSMTVTDGVGGDDDSMRLGSYVLAD